MISHGVKPAAREKASGRPWPSRLVNIAKQAGLTQPTVYGAERTSSIWRRRRRAVSRCSITTATAGSNFHRQRNAIRRRAPGGHQSPLSQQSRRHLHGCHGQGGIAPDRLGQGVAVGDYNNDGHHDFSSRTGARTPLSQQRRRHLHRCREGSGPDSEKPDYPTWYSGATFIDYDRDGHLDLFVATYTDYDLRRTPKPGAEPNLQLERRADAMRSAWTAARPPLPLSQSRRRNVRGRVGEVGDRQRMRQFRLHGRGRGFR